jgi:hypothetical protein
LRFDEEAAERQARGAEAIATPIPEQTPRRETPREQAERQALERQASQERVSRLQEPEPELTESIEVVERPPAQGEEGLRAGTDLGKPQGFYRELAEGEGVPAGGEYVVGMTGKNYVRTFRKKDFNWAADVMNGDFRGENLYKAELRKTKERGSGKPVAFDKRVWDDKQEGSIPFELVLNEDLDNTWASGRKTQNIPTKKGTYKFRRHGKRGVGGNAGLFNFFHQRGDIGQFGTKEGKGNSPDFTIDLHGNSDRIERLVGEGKISFRDTGADLQLPEPEVEGEDFSLIGQAAGAVGGAVASAGGVVGNAALGAVRGVGGAVYERLPSAGDIGEAAGRGAVAAVSGLAGAARGAYQAATSPRVGEQTGGTLGTDAEGRRIVGLGQTDEI